MFNTIGWQSYWVTIALLAAGYYLVIYLIYFRKDFSINWSKHGNTSGGKAIHSTATDCSSPSFESPLQPSLFDDSEKGQADLAESIEQAVYSCIDEINAYLEEAKRIKCVKEDVMHALHSILKKYSAICSSEYKKPVTNVIVNRCEYLCSLHLSADDVTRVWVGW